MTTPRPVGKCLDCGRQVRADRHGHLWATDPYDGHPLWCYDPAVPFADRPFRNHRLTNPDPAPVFGRSNQPKRQSQEMGDRVTALMREGVTQDQALDIAESEQEH